MIDSISVFVPVKNEESNIRKSLDEITRYMKKVASDYEILVINDGSTDKTVDIVKKLSECDPHIVLLHTNGHKGYGAAIRKGISCASKNLIFFTDGDGQYDIRELGSFLKAIEQHDYIIGYRKSLSQNILKKGYVKVHTVIARLVFGVRVKDVPCDFKLFHAQCIKNLELTSDGPFINIEILYKLQKKHYAYCEEEVAHYRRKFDNISRNPIMSYVRLPLEVIRLKCNL